MRACRFSAASPLVPGSAPSKASRRLLDGDLAERDSEPFGHEARVAARALAVVARRHGDGLDAVGPQRVGGQRGHERRVDAAREPEQHALEAVLAYVVDEPEAQRAPQLRGLARRHRCDRRGEDRPLAAERELDRDGRVHAVAAPAAQPRVAQALVHGGVQVEIADQELLRERGSAREHAAVGPEHGAAPVEHELVLTADEIAVGDRAEAVAGARREHLLARLTLAEVVGGGRDVEHADRSERGRLGHGVRQPDVLADRQRERALGRLDVQRAAAGRERALLVEDAVVGQLALVVAREDGAVGEHERRVAHAVAVQPRAAHDERHLDLAGEHLRLGLAGAQERGAQEQILGRVARDPELGGQHEVGARARGIGTGVGDALPVLGKRSDREVELGQREAEHRFHRSSGLLRWYREDQMPASTLYSP